MRPSRNTVLGIAGFAVLLVAALVASVGFSVSGRGALSVAYPSIPLASDKSLGINADLLELDPGTLETYLEALDDAGFRWLRQRFPWDAIEPARGSFDWKASDTLVEALADRQLRVIAVLDGAPSWAQAERDRGNSMAPPVETRDFGSFAGLFAARYRERIDYYQVWDEPNIAPHWGAREIDPGAYAHLLRDAAIQIRQADPTATILAAALAPNVEPGGANMSELAYLDALYARGADEWFDVVAGQPYLFDQAQDASPDSTELNWMRLAMLREVMERRGDDHTPVWAVSFGVPTHTATQDPSDLGLTVTALVAQARSEWPWLGPMLWAAWSGRDRHAEYALLDEGPSSRAGLSALKALAGAPPIAWPGTYAADHASGRYLGGWRVTTAGADIGATGDTLSVHFHGTRFDLGIRRGEYRAFLYVAVDGQPANRLPQDEDGRAYVVLYDPLGGADTVTLASGLADTDHLAEIVAEGGWGQWAITGWAVMREEANQRTWLPWFLGMCALAVLGIATRLFCPSLRQATALGGRLFRRVQAIDERAAAGVVGAVVVLLFVVDGTFPSHLALGATGLLLVVWPWAGLPVIAFVLPFYQLGIPLLGKVFSPVEVLTILTAIGWAANWLLRRDRPQLMGHPPRLVPADYGVVALVVLGAASLLWSEHVREAARELRTVVLGAALYYGLLRVMVRDPRRIWQVADAWLLGGCAAAAVGLTQWVSGQGLVATDGVLRIRAFYGSPNNLALYLGRVLPLAVSISLWGRVRPRKVAYVLATVIVSCAIVLTHSRGAWLLGVPAALLFVAALRGRRWLLAMAVSMSLAVGVVLGVVGPERMTLLFDFTEGGTFFRLQLWQSSLSMIRDYPVLGVGLDNFLYHYRTYYVLPTAWAEFNLSHPHNLLLDVWLRLGLPGLLVLGLLLVNAFRSGWRTARHRQAQTGEPALLALGLMGGLVDFLAHGLVDNALFLVDLAFAFMLAIALLHSLQCITQPVADNAVG